MNDSIKQTVSLHKVAVELAQCGLRFDISESLIRQGGGIRGEVARRRSGEGIEPGIASLVAPIEP